jgi:hypothetical protein
LLISLFDSSASPERFTRLQPRLPESALRVTLETLAVALGALYAAQAVH